MMGYGTRIYTRLDPCYHIFFENDQTNYAKRRVYLADAHQLSAAVLTVGQIGSNQILPS